MLNLRILCYRSFNNFLKNKFHREVTCHRSIEKTKVNFHKWKEKSPNKVRN